VSRPVVLDPAGETPTTTPPVREGDVLPEEGGTKTPAPPVATTTMAPLTPVKKPDVPKDDVPDVPKVTEKPPVTLRSGVGLSVGETLSVLSEEELRRRLDDMVSLGVAWIRVDIAWSSVQPEYNGAYRWAPADRVVREARARGIRVLGLLTYTPEWARAESCAYTKMCEPADPAAFAQFARAAAERYAAQGVFTWEVWNEPNLKLFWAAGASPERYAVLLRRTAEEIRAAVPSAVIISGGLAAVATRNGSMAAREYLERLYDAGARTSFDAVAYHPYSYPLAPHVYDASSPWSHMAETEWSILGIMRANGDGAKKIWITEYGAPTGGPGLAADTSVHGLPVSPTHVTENYQAIILREAFEENATYSYTGPLFWYSYRDIGTNDTTVEHHFGILRADGTTKPSYDVLRGVR
ncbi:MAG: hypothetical protein KBD21_04785, partial [Candidatus Pacebacteria bacterium]|nr:hypothetical protein [Candidatus Paceibacterota bacterium]